jgi:hypothetical protein
MFKRLIAIAAFAVIPLLGACDFDPFGPDSERTLETWGDALGDSWT